MFHHKHFVIWKTKLKVCTYLALYGKMYKIISACQCDQCGSDLCDRTDGQCTCKPNVIGPGCEQCAVCIKIYYKLNFYSVWIDLK